MYSANFSLPWSLVHCMEPPNSKAGRQKIRQINWLLTKKSFGQKIGLKIFEKIELEGGSKKESCC